jgi:hypothetical protein
MICRDIRRSYLDYQKTQKILNKLSKDFLIWFAGFWEGEGHLGCSIKRFRNKNYKAFRFQLTQKDKAFLNNLKKIFKQGCVYGIYYQITGTGKILAFLNILILYIKLKHRKKQIKNFLNWLHSKQLIKYLKKHK